MNENAERHGVSQIMPFNLHASGLDLHLQTVLCPKFILSLLLNISVFCSQRQLKGMPVSSMIV